MRVCLNLPIWCLRCIPPWSCLALTGSFPLSVCSSLPVCPTVRPGFAGPAPVSAGLLVFAPHSSESSLLRLPDSLLLRLPGSLLLHSSLLLCFSLLCSSSYTVLQALLDRYSISSDSFAAVCVIVDKIGKLPAEDIKKDLWAIGIKEETAEGILKDLTLTSLNELEELLGTESMAVIQLKELFALANQYGYSEWLHVDASVVRGLAYYTGVVFEGFDRDRKLRAICGGGRYDHLLSTFGGVDVPACGFGFGDAVIMELLKEKNLMPTLGREVDDIVWPLSRDLRQAAVMVASTLRKKGRNVDLILDEKRSKWVFKHAEKVNAKRLLVVGGDEWKRGAVRIKNLSTREECDVLFANLS